MNFRDAYEWAYSYVPKIDVEMAALLAQVFPVFVIAILLESRFNGSSFSTHRWVSMTVLYVRLFAVILPAGATFLCLQVVMLDRPYEGTDWFATIAAVALAVGFLVMCVDLLAREMR